MHHLHSRRAWLHQVCCFATQAIWVAAQRGSLWSAHACLPSTLPVPAVQVPIAVQGRIVNWIDSKATFGDDKLHRWAGLRQPGEQMHTADGRRDCPIGGTCLLQLRACCSCLPPNPSNTNPGLALFRHSHIFAACPLWLMVGTGEPSTPSSDLQAAGGRPVRAVRQQHCLHHNLSTCAAGNLPLRMQAADGGPVRAVCQPLWPRARHLLARLLS